MINVNDVIAPRTKLAGVYQIRNTVNDKVYIGCAVDIRGRLLKHLRDLRRGTHHSQKLQRAFVKYSEDAFTLSILEVVADHHDLLVKEQAFLDAKRPFENGYNVCRESRNRIGVKSSLETRAKISKANKGRKFSTEQREINRQAHLGITHTSETKEKIRLTSLGREHTDEAKAKIGDAHRGKKLPQEQVDRLRILHKGNTYWVGRTHTEETKKKLRGMDHPQGGTQPPRSYTPEQKALIADKTRQVHTGKVNSEETRRKMSAAKMGHGMSEEGRRKMREAWEARKARGVSDETRQKIKDAWARRKEREAGLTSPDECVDSKGADDTLT